ncbi:MAG: hypothetical protein F7C35_04400 [Desulfurococcales archaeon]|nr:hypothetical protein [Desulfurococcales archaeon]
MFHKLSKRELVSYYLLLRRGSMELGGAIELLSENLCMTKRAARRVIKRLKRLHLVKIKAGNGTLIIEARSAEEVLAETAEQYSESRRRRCYALAKREPEIEGQEPGYRASP